MWCSTSLFVITLEIARGYSEILSETGEMREPHLRILHMHMGHNHIPVYFYFFFPPLKGVVNAEGRKMQCSYMVQSAHLCSLTDGFAFRFQC